jgi:hypothetical protein
MGYFISEHLNVLRQGTNLAERIIRKETNWNVSGIYDVKTQTEQAGEKPETGVFAQLFRTDVDLDPYYRICLQDKEILRFVKDNGIDLLSFITFVMTHELLHIHRFSTGRADFFGISHDEEVVVDTLTRIFLAKNPVIGLNKVLALLDKVNAAPLYNEHIMKDGGRFIYAYL